MEDTDLGVAFYEAQYERQKAIGPLAYSVWGEKMDSDVFSLAARAVGELDQRVLTLALQYLQTYVGQAEWDYVVNEVGGPETEQEEA